MNPEDDYCNPLNIFFNEAIKKQKQDQQSEWNQFGIEIEHPYLLSQNSNLQGRQEYYSSPPDFFKNLDGFAVLEPLDQDIDWNENMMQHFQLDQADMKDLHLGKIFNEASDKGCLKINQDFARAQQVQKLQHPKQRQESSPSRVFQEQKSQQPQVQSQTQKIRKGSASLPSFPDLLDKMIENFIDNFSPNSFQEYNKYQVIEKIVKNKKKVAMNNIENFIFLEQNLKYPYAFKHFHTPYLRFIEKMKNYLTQQRLDFKQMIAFVCSMGLEFIQDVIGIIQKSEKAWCFEVLRVNENESTLLNQSGIHKMQENNQAQTIFNREDIGIQQLNKQINKTEQVIRQNENIDVLRRDMDLESNRKSDQYEKKMRKNWSEVELQTLALCIQQHPYQIPNNILQDLCQQLNRTPYSVSSKIHKLKKKLTGEQEDFSINNSINLQNGLFTSTNTELQSTGSILKSRQGSKYEYTLEDMIKIALKHLPDMKGSKSQILEKIRQIFALPQQDLQWSKSVSILLSSNKSNYLKKEKGYFVLNQIEPSILEQELGSIRKKIYLIIEQFRNKRGVFKEILEQFLVQEGIPQQDDVSVKMAKKRINQTLLQCSWFDKTRAKTTYSLIQNID